MRTALAVILIILGVLALVYQSIPYTTEETIVDIGPVKATREKEETLVVPPLRGAAAVLGGVVLLVIGRRGRRSG
jgi:hypothetical protein